MTANPALLTVQPDFTHQAMPSKPATLADFAQPRPNQPGLYFASGGVQHQQRPCDRPRSQLESGFRRS
jgi:hypothetical protein